MTELFNKKKKLRDLSIMLFGRSAKLHVIPVELRYTKFRLENLFFGEFVAVLPF